jgi:hypothetical protein
MDVGLLTAAMDTARRVAELRAKPGSLSSDDMASMAELCRKQAELLAQAQMPSFLEATRLSVVDGLVRNYAEWMGRSCFGEPE